MKKKLAISCGLLSAFLAIGLACLLGAYPGPVGQIGTQNWVQTSPLVLNDPIVGSGSFTLSSTASAYLSSGGTAATSVPSTYVVLSVSGTAANLSTSSSAALALPVGTILTLSTSNLNSLKVSGSGATIGYLWGD